MCDCFQERLQNLFAQAVPFAERCDNAVADLIDMGALPSRASVGLDRLRFDRPHVFSDRTFCELQAINQDIDKVLSDEWYLDRASPDDSPEDAWAHFRTPRGADIFHKAQPLLALEETLMELRALFEAQNYAQQFLDGCFPPE